MGSLERKVETISFVLYSIIEVIIVDLIYPEVSLLSLKIRRAVTQKYKFCPVFLILLDFFLNLVLVYILLTVLSLTSKDASQRLDRLTVGETCAALPLRKKDADLKDVKSLCPNMLFSPLLVFPQEKKISHVYANLYSLQ